MLHTNSVNVDNSSDKLTVTETETENQSTLDFGSPLKALTPKVGGDIKVNAFVAIPKDD